MSDTRMCGSLQAQFTWASPCPWATSWQRSPSASPGTSTVTSSARIIVPSPILSGLTAKRASALLAFIGRKRTGRDYADEATLDLRCSYGLYVF